VINMRDGMRVLKETEPDAIVLVAETATVAWADIVGPDDKYLPVSSMSKASSVALGIAIAQPERKVVVWDGDGCLLMNLGTLITVARAAPPNLIHIILENGVYALTGAQPLPSQYVSDLPEMARSAGYRHIHTYSDTEAFKTDLPAILAADGPTLISLETETEVIPVVGWSKRPNPPKNWKTIVPVIKRDITEKSDAVGLD